MEPLYRRAYDAAALLRDHPPVFRHPHKAAPFQGASPGGAGASGTIDVTRWAAHLPSTLELPAGQATEVRPAFSDYFPGIDDAAGLEWHVNFADPRVFAAYGSGLLAQDEMQVVEHPLL